MSTKTPESVPYSPDSHTTPSWRRMTLAVLLLWNRDSDLWLRDGEVGARHQPFDFRMKRQNSFDVTNPSGSDRIEIGAGLQSLVREHMRKLWRDQSLCFSLN
ncbi:hypothetical protein AVEN_33148-1 [Araneus ventricosus]|uniref:Uncharacterized protein n=1 Tax=Araneus ventricosus TaxID=182803 RepID=A0A4Y2LHA7_ARAVE|nr:hypothetical protein AVEN_33148-1 [Araneus ventricosus]